jgi:hypothetical protein
MGANMIGNKYDRPKSGVRVSMAQETFEQIKNKTAKEAFDKGQASLIKILIGFNKGEILRHQLNVDFDGDVNAMFYELVNRLEPTPRNDYVR